MMRLKAKDMVASVLVAAIAVPYIGYLVSGDMPFIKDARGMTGTGVVLGIAAFFVMWWGDPLDQAGKAETAAAVVSLVLGAAALAFAETAAADVLLAVFMTSIALVWFMKLVDHAGGLHWHEPTGVAR
jgi:hypothetical protein